MAELRYECSRSASKIEHHVVCYEDSFYDLPLDVRVRGPWYTLHRGPVAELKPEIQFALAEHGYIEIEAPIPQFSALIKIAEDVARKFTSGELYA